ncbi:chromosome segregation ATPase [Azospirillum fermentarium]|uniref:flagellar FliJ family protein n=1 Tax=Azospirillum fermentarium TaxID=1233114 RepID=UPI00222674C4|nr:flagellar FliJ family protein [Azospirillum fermentarium]MCW2246356.1 chromosome segregation ATPase [Azospirillum fermentarium]
MSSFKTLIRVQKWQLDEKRRALTELQNLEDRLRSEIDRLAEEMRAEQETARNDFNASFTYAGFARSAMERRRRIDDSIRQVQEQIVAATEQVAEAYQDLKRYELAEEERLKREREKQKHKEELMMDETALVGFRRRQEQDGTG